IGELKDDAVADTAGATQCFWSIACDPNRWDASVGPTHLDGMAVVYDLLAAIEIANNANRMFEIFQRCRFFPHNSARAIAAADAAIHTTTRNLIQCGEQTCGDSRITNDRIRDTCAKSHIPSIGCH